MKIAKEEFDLLYSDNVTKKKYDEIINKINERFNEIIDIIWPKNKRRNGSWYDYGNCIYFGEFSNGFFDTQRYKKYIPIGGEGVNLPPPYNKCCDIPTRWLWQDFEEEFNAEVKKEIDFLNDKKAEDKKRREQGELNKRQLMESIKSKLTAEEFKYVMSLKKKG